MPWKWQQEADMWIEREARKVDPRDYAEEPEPDAPEDYEDWRD